MATTVIARSDVALDERDTLPSFPNGWFSVALSREVPAGSVVGRRLFGKHVVVCRSQSGRVGVFDATCPHLGASLAAGGTVVGEQIVCPFHDFRFDFDGVCVEAYEAGHACSGRLACYRVEEVNGIIFVHNDQSGRAPSWSIPPLGDDGWTPLRFRRWHLRTHPQEVHENAPDLGHLRRLHGFIIDGFTASSVGERYISSYRSEKPGGILGKGSKTLELDIDGYMVGLGFAVTFVFLRNLNLKSRIFTLTTPTDTGELDLTIAMSMRSISESNLGIVTRRLPKRIVFAVSHLLVAGLLAASAKEVEKDAAIWEHKEYLANPRLAIGDGPIVQYRKWARQFYS
jgi:phenylpropionate dioxygenase-like ring-hydroxylating dioxygenase large terminal subunit